MNIVILWELSGIKSTEEQYIIAIYQIDTNYISVQAWNRMPRLYVKVVGIPLCTDVVITAPRYMHGDHYIISCTQ